MQKIIKWVLGKLRASETGEQRAGRTEVALPALKDTFGKWVTLFLRLKFLQRSKEDLSEEFTK